MYGELEQAMKADSLNDCYACLGLSSEATLDEVDRSYRKLSNLYGEESLATYSLLDDDERKNKLETLKTAYQQIQHARPRTNKVVPLERVSKNKHSPPSHQPVCISADPKEMPGLFLKQLRLSLGLSLRDVAEITKVGSSYLTKIEEQNLDGLPAPVYLRGFLREFARTVKAPNAETLIENFFSLYEKSS
jgi:flagellar biosynthesis protein FlhG